MKNKLMPKAPPADFNQKARKIDSLKMWRPNQVSLGVFRQIDESEKLANAVHELPEPKKSSSILGNKGKLI